jgi:hypothetical protein
MGEVEARLALERDRNGSDRRIDLVLLDGIEKAVEIVVIRAKLVRGLELRGDLLPQLDAEPRPLPVVTAHDKRRHAHGADHDLCGRLGVRRLGVRRRRRHPQNEHEDERTPHDRGERLCSRKRHHRAADFIET